jgi:hypothetical protein
VGECPSCGQDSSSPTANEESFFGKLATDLGATAAQIGQFVLLLLAPLRGIRSNTNPLKPEFQRTWSVGNQNLPQPVTIGSALLGLDLTSFVPQGCRSILMRNGSPTRSVLYWFVGGKLSPPTPDTSSIPPSTAVAIDCDPSTSGLAVQIDNTGADASFEASFFT